MALINNDSILMSIKHMLNIEDEEMHFDNDVGMFINSEFMTLNQLGIGKPGFSIVDANTKWTDFSDDLTLIQTVKEYVYLRARLVFDPPASSIVAEEFNKKLQEDQWRLNIQAEKSWEEYDGQSDEGQYHSDRHEIDGENLIIRTLR